MSTIWVFWDYILRFIALMNPINSSIFLLTVFWKSYRLDWLVFSYFYYY